MASRRLFVRTLACLITLACSPKGTTDPKPEPWVPSLENFARYPHAREIVLTDLSGEHRFSLEVRSFNLKLLEDIHADDFEIEVLPPEAPPDDPEDRPEIGVGIDGVLYDHDEAPQDPGEALTSPPPIFLKLHYLGAEEPSFFFRPKRPLAAGGYAGVVNAGHYKSIVLRRPGATTATPVVFYHHHGDWQLHTLYQGRYVRCTYAYDCLPGHSIPSWYDPAHGEVGFGDHCYLRCP